MELAFCLECHRYHEPGLWACPAVEQEPPEIQSPLPPSDREPVQPPLIQKPKRPSLSDALDHWTSIYERNLAEFASETDGAPTIAHVRRAEQLADREIRMMFGA